MRVLVVDPLCSTIPYDRALCAALAGEGMNVRFASVRLRDSAWDLSAVPHVELKLTNIFRRKSGTHAENRIATALLYARYAGQLRQIRAEAIRFGADIVHFQWCLAPLADLVLLRSLPKSIGTVFTMHDTVPFNGAPVSRYSLIGLDRLLRGFDRIILHTRHAENMVRARGLDPSRTEVVSHGALGPVPSSGYVRERSDERLPLCFLLFGIISHYKGVDLLIQAVSQLPDAVRARARFRIVGRPDLDIRVYRSMMAELGVEDLVTIEPRFVHDDEVETLLGSADVAVFPYRQIQSSGIFSITSRFGLPAVATDTGEFSEAIRKSGAGLLVDRESVGGLAAAITRLVEDPEELKRISDAAVAAAGKRPSWNAIASATEQVYRSAAQGRGRGRGDER